MRKRDVVIRRQEPSKNSNSSSTSDKTYYRYVIYKECQKNHAAEVGGYAVDGCREFMAMGAEDALSCAACGCHRNFHKKVLVK